MRRDLVTLLAISAGVALVAAICTTAFLVSGLGALLATSAAFSGISVGVAIGFLLRR